MKSEEAIMVYMIIMSTQILLQKTRQHRFYGSREISIEFITQKYTMYQYHREKHIFYLIVFEIFINFYIRVLEI